MGRQVSIEHKFADGLINVVLDTLAKNKQALIFVNSKRAAEKVALDVAKKVKNVDEHTLAKEILDVLGSPTEQCQKLSLAAQHGVAFHHAGLASKQRELIEDGFREGTIRIIASTPTLAAGLDMPAFRVIIRDVKRFTGSWGMQHIPVLEYHQMAGRAGRPGHEDYGEAITLAKTDVDKDEIEQVFILGKPEPIYSKLAVEPVLRTYMLSLIATGYIDSISSAMQFFSKTFWAQQYGDMHKLESIILRVVHMLCTYEFLVKDTVEEENGFTSAASLLRDQEAKLKATPVGERVAQLYLDPLSAKHIIDGLQKEVPTDVFGYVQLLCHTLEMRPLVTVKQREIPTIEDVLSEYKEHLLMDEVTWHDHEYHDFLNSIKTALCFRDWIDEAGEDLLLERYNVRPGELKAKSDIMEWLLLCSIELTKVLQTKKHMGPLTALKMRVVYGVRKELLPLLRFMGIGRKRARSLYVAGIKDSGAIKSVSEEKLAGIVGPKIAANLKKQVNQEGSTFSKLEV